MFNGIDEDFTELNSTNYNTGLAIAAEVTITLVLLLVALSGFFIGLFCVRMGQRRRQKEVRAHLNESGITGLE